MSFLLVYDAAGALSDVFSWDVTNSERHGSGATVTKFPVEEGADVADHIRHNSRTLTLEVFVTNTPAHPRINLKTGVSNGRFETRALNLPSRNATAQGAVAKTQAGLALARTIVNAVGLPGARFIPPGPVDATARKTLSVAPSVMATVLAFDPFEAILEFYFALLDLQLSKKLVTVVTSLGEYRYRALVNIGVSRSQQDGGPGGATFELEFECIRKVQLATVTAPKVPAEPRGAPAQDKGNKSGKDGALLSKDSKSVLARLQDFAFPPK